MKKLTSIRFLEVYEALRDIDGGTVGQFEHTVYVTEGGPEVLTVGVIFFTTIIYRRLSGDIVQDEKVLAECIPSPRYYLSPVHLFYSSEVSILPKIVTSIIENKIIIIPIDCCIEGDSSRKITPQTIVNTGCTRTANDVCDPGNLGNA